MKKQYKYYFTRKNQSFNASFPFLVLCRSFFDLPTVVRHFNDDDEQCRTFIAVVIR
jgi:hypothetical protein